MNLAKMLGAPALAVMALAITAVPARAQHRGGGRGGAVGHAVPRAVGHAVPRSVAVPRVVTGGRGVIGGQGVIGGHGVIAAPYGRYFYRPYYAFRPHFSLGFGLYAGYPVAYPYFGPYGYYGYRSYYGYYGPYGPYPHPYAYPNPYPYGYPYPPPPVSGYSGYSSSAPGVSVAPGTTASGGVSFEITPGDAGVYVDGMYVGTVGDFTPASQPLSLAAGRHRIEVQAPGYQTMTFDVDVVPGQVTPYRGTMEPVRQ